MIIRKAAEDNYYRQLQDKTLLRLEQLCGKRWTDFNVHDPGLTIADYFNYALFELDYRLNQPLEAYLMAPGEKTIPFLQRGLLPKEELFAKSIVTPNDYHNLIQQYIPEVKRCRVLFNKGRGNYEIYIAVGKDTTDKQEENIRLQVVRLYHKNRNLCETLGEVFIDKHDNNDYFTPGVEESFREEVYEFPEFEVPGIPVQPIQPLDGQYHSIQTDFPEAYGLGERGVPFGSVYNHEHAKILQLKAYLLIIDHLLADTLSQAAGIHDFLGLTGHTTPKGITEVHIPEAGRIVDAEKKAATVLHTTDYYDGQKALYFNMLDVLYGEDTADIFHYNPKIPRHVINERRASLVRRLPWLNMHRFTSFNIYDADSIPTIQQTVEELTGHSNIGGQPDTFLKYGLRVISDEEFYHKYKFLQQTSLIIDLDQDAHLEHIDEINILYEDDTFHMLRMNINLLWYNILFKSFVEYGDDKKHYRILYLAEDEYLLVFMHPTKKEWINMGLFFNSKRKLIETANLFWQFIRSIKHRVARNHFHFVEHLLLGQGNDKNELSVIIEDEHKGADNRQHIEEVLNERIPAHLSVAVYYLSHHLLEHFIHTYTTWRRALAAGDEAGIKDTSAHLRTFLSDHKHHSIQL